MRWDPDHIRHIACAGRLYSLLLQQQEGIHFLQTDVRGGVLQVTTNKASPSLFADKLVLFIRFAFFLFLQSTLDLFLAHASPTDELSHLSRRKS